MHRIAQIKANLTHRRSKSDSLIEKWGTTCLQADTDDEAFHDPDPSEFSSFATEPAGDGSDQDPAPFPCAPHPEVKRSSSSGLPFVAQLGGSLRRKFGSSGSLRLRGGDGTHLAPSEPACDFIYDNDALRTQAEATPAGAAASTAVSHPLEAEPDTGGDSADAETPEVASPALDAFGAPVWVTFDDEGPAPTPDPAAEFFDVPLDDEESQPSSPGQRLMQNLRKLPSRFKANSRYQSLETDSLSPWGDGGPPDGFNFQRSSSLPTTPTLKKKLFGNMKL